MPPSDTAIMIQRRRFMQLGTAALLLPGLPLLSGCSQTPPLKIAVQPWCGYQFIKLAYQQGWMSQQRIQLVDTAMTNESVAALREGRVDGAALTLDEVLCLLDEGMQLSVVLLCDISAGADVMLARPELSTLADMRGKRIGVERSSLGELMLVKTLQAAGLLRTDVVEVQMNEQDHVLAWQRENLDAIITYDPSRMTLVDQGLQSLFDSRQLPMLILDLLVVRNDVLDDKAAALRELVAGHFYALQQWRDNPVDIAYRLAPLLSVTADKVDEVYKGLNLPDLLYNRLIFENPMSDLTAAANEVGQIMLAAGELNNIPVTDRLFTGDYLPEETK